MSEYVPIACAVHDVYERAILKKLSLLAEWTENGRRLHGSIKPTRLDVVQSEEFLSFESAAMSHRVRLDHIRLI